MKGKEVIPEPLGEVWNQEIKQKALGLTRENKVNGKSCPGPLKSDPHVSDSCTHCGTLHLTLEQGPIQPRLGFQAT